MLKLVATLVLLVLCCLPSHGQSASNFDTRSVGWSAERRQLVCNDLFQLQAHLTSTSKPSRHSKYFRIPEVHSLLTENIYERLAKQSLHPLLESARARAPREVTQLPGAELGDLNSLAFPDWIVDTRSHLVYLPYEDDSTIVVDLYTGHQVHKLSHVDLPICVIGQSLLALTHKERAWRLALLNLKTGWHLQYLSEPLPIPSNVESLRERDVTVERGAGDLLLISWRYAENVPFGSGIPFFGFACKRQTAQSGIFSFDLKRRAIGSVSVNPNKQIADKADCQMAANALECLAIDNYLFSIVERPAVFTGVLTPSGSLVGRELRVIDKRTGSVAWSKDLPSVFIPAVP